MDITITVPKEQKDIWLKEIELAKKTNLELLFKVAQFPTKTEIGDKCFVILNNEIIGYHLIKRFVTSTGFTCQLTGKYWGEGKYIARHGASWTKLKLPLPKKGHRGFEYVNGNIKEMLDIDMNMTKFKQYTWEELRDFERLGIQGQICICTIRIANTMTLQCIRCGKILPQYARNYLKRHSK